MKIHVLDAVGGGRYRVLLHAPMPAGNNSVGLSWKAVWVAAGLNTSAMTVGALPGQIDQAERDAIVAGDVIEIHSEIQAETGGATAASITQMADAIINGHLAALAVRLKYFGYTQAT